MIDVPAPLLSILISFEDRFRLFGIKIIDVADFTEMLVRFGFNTLVLLIVVRYLYYAGTKRKDYFFTYFMFGTVIFFLCQIMSNVKLEMGFGLGLFALFSLLRYRTDPIPIKEMTYLFIVIGVSVLNALSTKKVSYMELLLMNTGIVGLTYLLERVWMKKFESNQRITYEKIELIKPEMRKELIADLRERTGLDIHRVKIERIDFLRDTATIYIFYHEGKDQDSDST